MDAATKGPRRLRRVTDASRREARGNGLHGTWDAAIYLFGTGGTARMGAMAAFPFRQRGGASHAAQRKIAVGALDEVRFRRRPVFYSASFESHTRKFVRGLNACFAFTPRLIARAVSCSRLSLGCPRTAG